MLNVMTSLLCSAAEAALADQIVTALTRAPAQLALALAAACLGVASAGCIAAAVWLAALPHLGEAGAPLLVAFLLAAAAVLCALCLRRPVPARPESRMVAHNAGTRPEAAILLSAAVAGFASGLAGVPAPHG